jgi:predicted dienelactone hydrolase
MGAGIRVMDVDADQWNASYGDPRVTHVMALDPGLIWGLEDAAGLVENVTLIGLGDGEDRMLATDFDASGLADLLPGAQVLRITPAVHFTALPLCKPMGAAILIEEGDDPVCDDPEGADRAAIHLQIIEQMAADLGL